MQNLMSGPSVRITVQDLEKIQMLVRKFDSVQDGFYRADPAVTIGINLPTRQRVENTVGICITHYSNHLNTEHLNTGFI